jgi:hypothetical protein
MPVRGVCVVASRGGYRQVQLNPQLKDESVRTT